MLARDPDIMAKGIQKIIQNPSQLYALLLGKRCFLAVEQHLLHLEVDIGAVVFLVNDIVGKHGQERAPHAALGPIAQPHLRLAGVHHLHSATFPCVSLKLTQRRIGELVVVRVMIEVEAHVLCPQEPHARVAAAIGRVNLVGPNRDGRVVV